MSILANSRAYKDIDNDIATGNLSHAYILFSGDQIAVERLFFMIAERISCLMGGCGECNTCSLILSGAHPDVKFYDGTKMRVEEDVEPLIESTLLYGAMQDKKLYFIKNAEKLSVGCQNKLLKTYEEPPQNVTIFLASATDSALLPTIKSRAKKLYLPAFSTEEIVEEMLEEGFSQDEAELVASAAGGSYTRALKLAADEKYAEQYAEVFRVLVETQRSADIVKVLGQELFSKDNLATTLDFIEIILSDVLIVAAKGDRRTISTMKTDELEVISRGFSPLAVAEAIRAVARAREKLALNLNNTTIAEALLYEILEARYKWQR